MTEPLQKPGRSCQTYGTPPEFLEAVKARLRIERFDCDLAASHANTVAYTYLTETIDALGRDWKFGHGWNWLNPPYAAIGPWVQKAHLEWLDNDVQTAVLVPAAVGSNWWRDYVHQRCQVMFLNGRIRFVGAKDVYPKDCALLLYGSDDAPRYDVWTWKQPKAALEHAKAVA